MEKLLSPFIEAPAGTRCPAGVPAITIDTLTASATYAIALTNGKPAQAR